MRDVEFLDIKEVAMLIGEWTESFGLGLVRKSRDQIFNDSNVLYRMIFVLKPPPQ